MNIDDRREHIPISPKEIIHVHQRILNVHGKENEKNLRKKFKMNRIVLFDLLSMMGLFYLIFVQCQIAF